MKFADFPVQRGDEPTPGPDEPEHRVLQHVALAKARRQADSRSPISLSGSEKDGGRARTTTSAAHGLGRPATRCRRRRLTRLRATAFPIAFDTTKPTRVSSGGFRSLTATWTTTLGVPARAPRRNVAVKSRERRNRRDRGSTTGIRLTVPSDPCGGARSGWHDRRGCACGSGNRAYGCGGDCSAGRCACSCDDSVGDLRLGKVPLPWAAAVQRYAQRRISTNRVPRHPDPANYTVVVLEHGHFHVADGFPGH